MKDFMKKFKLDAHHSIERFGILVLILTISTVILMTSITTHVISTNAHALDDKAIYTEKFTSSLTSTKGEVHNIYTNKDKTSCFVLLYFKDTSKVSTNAADYKLFLTGSNPEGTKEKIKTQPAGVIYMFGSTGYMGIHLVAKDGFAKQVMMLTVRCTKQLQDAEVSEKDEYADGSFKSHDQFRIYFNPAGNDAVQADFLDAPKFDIASMYYSCVAYEKEQEKRKELNEALYSMSTQLNVIEEYGRRLSDEDGIQLPQMPEQVAGDSIQAKAVDGRPVTWKTDVWVDEDGKAVNREDLNYYLISDYRIKGGVDFRWQDGNVYDGYLKDLYPGSNYEYFFNQLKEEVESSIQYGDWQWYRKDGSQFNYSASGGNSRGTTDGELNIDIKAYIDAIDAYYTAKRNYETKLLIELLDIELEVINVSSRWTVNNSVDLMTIY